MTERDPLDQLCACGHEKRSHVIASLDCLQCTCAGYRETNRHKDDIRKKLVELHRLLGEYEMYAMRHGSIAPERGEQTEIECIHQLQSAIEKRTPNL